MQAQELIDYCLKKKGTYVDFPFGDCITVIKVKGRIFAQLFILKGVLTIILRLQVDERVSIPVVFCQ